MIKVKWVNPTLTNLGVEGTESNNIKVFCNDTINSKSRVCSKYTISNNISGAYPCQYAYDGNKPEHDKGKVKCSSPSMDDDGSGDEAPTS